MRNLLLLSAATLLVISPQAMAKSIYTGGEKGAYNSTFCPPLPTALAKAQFLGYRCTPSNGTLDNIQKVIANPNDIGFVQLDVFAREAASNPDVTKKLTVIRSLACEGLWVVTKNDRIKDYSDIFTLARRLPFRLPPQNSGSSATFAYMQSLDKDGIGRIQPTNVHYDRDVGSMLQAVAASQSGDVGMFVQFADPENANIKKMLELGLRPIAVISKDLLNAKIGDKEVYQLQEFELAAGWFSGKKLTTTCTPSAIITGNPESITNENDRSNQKDMIQEISNMPETALLPQDSRITKLMKGMQHVTGKALQEAVGAAEAAKRKAIEIAQ